MDQVEFQGRSYLSRIGQLLLFPVASKVEPEANGWMIDQRIRRLVR